MSLSPILSPAPHPLCAHLLSCLQQKRPFRYHWAQQEDADLGRPV
ncbi:MAG: hypothetical protein RLZZ157_1827 [Pseudomonadota bacterium]|jgi:hypothetical protein